MKTYEQWKAEIDFAIESIKSVGRKLYYGLSLQMTDETAGMLKRDYEASGHAVISRKCPKGLWDLIIEIR